MENWPCKGCLDCFRSTVCRLRIMWGLVESWRLTSPLDLAWMMKLRPGPPLSVESLESGGKRVFVEESKKSPLVRF